MQSFATKASGAAAISVGLLTALPAAATLITVSGSGTSSPASIQGFVTTFQNDLGGINNGNTLMSFPTGRREINWDGGGGVSTSASGGTPFDVFLNNRGARFITPGTGFLQATPAGLATAPPNGFNNPTYANIFSTFSPLRDFTPVGSNVTQGLFFTPGSNGGTPATVSGFGAVFSNVELANATEIDFSARMEIR
jgi:hypothetical protein